MSKKKMRVRRFMPQLIPTPVDYERAFFYFLYGYIEFLPACMRLDDWHIGK